MTCVFAGPNEDIPVKVSGNVKNGFEAEFVPSEVGLHTVLVEYNGVAVGGTPFFAKVPSIFVLMEQSHDFVIFRLTTLPPSPSPTSQSLHRARPSPSQVCTQSMHELFC